jgi:cell division protein FtsB
MKIKNSILIVFTIFPLVISCISTAKIQDSQNEITRLESLLQKERQENDQLNTQRSIFESQINALNSEKIKQITESTLQVQALQLEVSKLKEEVAQIEQKNKSLNAEIATLEDKNKSIVAELDSRIELLVEEKKDLQSEKYELRKEVYKAQNPKRKKRRR